MCTSSKGDAPVQYLTQMIHTLLEQLFYLTGSYGWAILLLTLVVRLGLTPLYLYSQRASKRSAAVQEEAKAIQERYAGEEQQKRLQELYSRSGGAMLAGCLPMLAQWPVFLAMYQALTSFYVVSAGFFWLQNLAAPDPYFILPILVVATQLWQSLATLPQSQRAVALILPLVMGFILIKASSAISLYWLAGNLISLAQHYLVTRRPQTA